MHSVNQLKGYVLAAPDGDIGAVREVYFDDHRWVIRHLVVETGSWLNARPVLVSPHVVRGIDDEAHRLVVSSTRSQVRAAPGIESDRPVSRQYEIASADHYGYPYYWGGPGLWGVMDVPLMGPAAPPLPLGGLASVNDETLARDTELRARLQAEQERANPNLRSSAEVSGYDIAASDGDIGHVDDFLFDPANWRIDLVVVDTHNWLPDRLVLVPPRWIENVDWAGRRVGVQVTRAAVEASPPYERRLPLHGDEAARIKRHFEGWL